MKLTRHLIAASLAAALTLPAFAHDDEEFQFPININEATVEQLTEIPGIGPKRAEAIIEHRNENGRFSSIDDLASIPGISEAFVERNREI